MIEETFKVQNFLKSTNPFSNFYVCERPFEFRGRLWNCSEMAYQACKAVHEEDIDKLAAMTDPFEAREFGQTIDMRKDWFDVRIKEMYAVLEAKFSDPELREVLLQTGDNYLREQCRNGEAFWGFYTPPNSMCKQPRGGENALGMCLMLLRAQIRSSEAVKKELAEFEKNQKLAED